MGPVGVSGSKGPKVCHVINQCWCAILRMCECVLVEGLPFLYPKAAILLVSTKNCDFWLISVLKVFDCRTSGQI